MRFWRSARHPCGETKFFESVGDEQALERLRDMSETPPLFVTAAAMTHVRGERVLRDLESLMPGLRIWCEEKLRSSRSQEVFRVAMSDHASMIVLPSLLASVRRAATHVSWKCPLWG